MASKVTVAKQVKLKPISKKIVSVRLVGISPLVQHKWSEKARKMIRDKQQEGKKTKDRELRNPEQEGRDAMHMTEDGKPGVPAAAIKAAIINAAHKDLGCEKTLVRKALFVLPMGRDVVIPLAGNGKPLEVEIVEDTVRVGQGIADLRYRPYITNWSLTIEVEINEELLQMQDVLFLLERAGFGVGLLERRPERGGDFGRFEVDLKSVKEGKAK